MKCEVVTALVVEDREPFRVFMARRDKPSNPFEHDKWYFPGGKIEEGETLEECIIREMNEEFGDGPVDDCLTQLNVHLIPAIHSIFNSKILIPFLTPGFKMNLPHIIPNTGNSECRWFTIPQFRELLDEEIMIPEVTRVIFEEVVSIITSDLAINISYEED